MRTKRALITGATGFIGRRLSEQAIKSGYDVCGMGRGDAQGPWSSYMKADISNPSEKLDLRGFDTVFHLASKAHALSEKPSDESGYREVIVDGTHRLVSAAEFAGVNTLIYLSSVKAIGEGESAADSAEPITEAENCRPETPYGCCKLEAEKLVIESSIPHVVILRPTMVYGPGHKGNLVRMAEAIRKKRFPPIKENGNRRSMVHVDDVVEAALLAVDISNANRNAYIITANESKSTRELYDALREEMGLAPVNWHTPPSLLELAAKCGDILGSLVGRRMPLDSETLSKLIRSAWYDNTKSRTDLKLAYTNSARPMLEDSSENALF